MPAKIDSALQKELRGPEDAMFNVEIEFSRQPPAHELDALGLQHEGLLAWGRLSRLRIQGLEQVPEVVKIRPSSRPAPETGRGKAQIGGRLEMEMEEESKDEFYVAVRFRGPVKSATDFPFLSVQLDVGTGVLTREQIQELAQREDVVSIDSIPPSKLFNN
jgi:hypothetical protein